MDGIAEFGTDAFPEETDRERLMHLVHELYEDVRPALYRFIGSELRSRQEIEDVIQEAFVRLMAELAAGKSIGNPRAWVFRVSHNLAMDVHRRAGGTVDLAENAVTPVANPEDSTRESERHEAVERAVAFLTPPERRCLELRAEGLRYREIAAILGLQVSTVATFVSRAIRKIARQLNA